MHSTVFIENVNNMKVSQTRPGAIDLSEVLITSCPSSRRQERIFRCTSGCSSWPLTFMCGKPEADFTTSTKETGKDISIPSVTKFPPKVVVGLMSTTAGTLNSSGEFTCRIGSTPAETSGRTSITSTLCFSTASVSPDSRLSFIRARIWWETIQPKNSPL